MEVEILEIGRLKSKAIVIDNFLPNALDAVDAAAAIADFPAEGTTAYPGRRHQIGPADKASSCVMDILKMASPLIQSQYDAGNFRVLEASFSLLTTLPEEMSPRQRIPHYDWAETNHLAILLHLHHVPNTGTAFYRHIASDLEHVTKDAVPEYIKRVQVELAETDLDPISSGGQSNIHFEKIAQVEAKFNRLVMYRGCLLHSGYVSSDFNFSGDPRTGRLTANVFVQTAKGSS